MPSDGRHGRCFRAVTGAGGFETRPYGCYGRTDAWHEIMVNEHHAAPGRAGAGVPAAICWISMRGLPETADEPM